MEGPFSVFWLTPFTQVSTRVGSEMVEKLETELESLLEFNSLSTREKGAVREAVPTAEGIRKL